MDHELHSLSYQSRSGKEKRLVCPVGYFYIYAETKIPEPCPVEDWCRQSGLKDALNLCPAGSTCSSHTAYLELGSGIISCLAEHYCRSGSFPFNAESSINQVHSPTRCSVTLFCPRERNFQMLD